MKKKRLLKRSLPVIFIVILSGLIYCAYHYEQQVKPNIRFFDVIENSIIILMGEYPDKPVSTESRIIQLILLIFGTLLFGAIIGKVSSLFVLKSLKERNMSNLQNHFIICNWNKKAKSIIEQLQKANKNSNSKIIVISTSEIEKNPDLDNVIYANDDPTYHSILRKYNASTAKSIILLADENTYSPDEKNALIALAIKYLEGEKKQDIRVIAELINPDLKKHLKDAGVDEVICSADYSSGIIAQSAIFDNMSEIYQDLLTYSDKTNEIYFVENLSSDDKSFAEIAESINQKYKKKPLILLGIKKGDKILLNPEKEIMVNMSDKLIVLSYTDIQKL
ncbi:MAG: NAD-binding protein [Bacteroidota bacterium]|nr:NAD-binding protein [Bacteroidota bacterium]